MSLFAAAPAQQQQGARVLVQIKAGKLNLEGTTLTPDPRKGLLVIRKSDDGLMHLIWQDRSSGTVEDDLILFQGDATLKHLPGCTDGYAMLLEFGQTGRRVFFWSQEGRKKDLGWTGDDIAKESELLEKANGFLTGTAAAPSPAAGDPGFGALGMTHGELMAMLSGGTGMPPSPSGGAAAPSAAAPAPTAAPVAAPAASAASGPISADAISSILSGITPPPGASATAPVPISADAISSILSGINTGQPQQVGPGITDVLRPEATVPLVEQAMEAQLAEHLPQAAGESVAETLSTPQFQQESTDATKAVSSSGETADAMDTDDGDKPDQMQE